MDKDFPRKATRRRKAHHLRSLSQMVSWGNVPVVSSFQEVDENDAEATFHAKALRQKNSDEKTVQYIEMAKAPLCAYLLGIQQSLKT